MARAGPQHFLVDNRRAVWYQAPQSLQETPHLFVMSTDFKNKLSRRALLKNLAAAGGFAVVGASGEALAAQPARPGSRPAGRSPRWAAAISRRVFETSLVDTHEHLIEEEERLRGATGGRVPCDDWALLFSHYLNSDLQTAGMSPADLSRFLSPGMDPAAKWKLLEPHWPAVKNTGYGQAVRIAIRELYGVEELSAATVKQVQRGYEQTRKPGFYQRILREQAGLESCQVNCLSAPFRKSAQPLLLMQDLSIVGMFAGPNLDAFGRPTGIEVRGLADWHRVIDWWFARYGPYAVAVKSQHAYQRDLDYARVPAEKAEPVFLKRLRRDPVPAEEQKLLEDHLFWHAVDKATEHDLPVKLHTGYYAGANSMPLGRVQRNPASASDLCRLSPGTRFVFMHICYPHYEDLLALAKQFSNAFVDMCWSWIINPIAAKDYLKKHLVTAPANKVLTFGGDYIPVEPVLGHAILARRGIAQALSELVEEGWLTLDDALELVEPLLHGNARKIFRLEAKAAALRTADWVK